MKKHTVAELNELYKNSEACDKEIFAEARSNIQLVVGEHYNKRNSIFHERIRSSRELSTDQKLRLTKNHIYKISKIRKNILLSHASGVRVLPNNESELQDQKSAELNQAVWNYAKSEHDLRKRTNTWAAQFFEIGEVAVKIFFDPSAGKFQGYKQQVDENGNGQVDENGQMMAGDEAQFSGDLIIEDIYGFNLLRDPSAKKMSESPYLTIRKMVQVDDLKRMCAGDEDKLRAIADGQDDTYTVFDTSKVKYLNEKGITTLKETFFKPCPEMPMGYFYIFIEGTILFEGELPFGIFPIVYEGHDEIPTMPRHRSPIKQFRPYQIEINRASSLVAEHHVTLGSDKVVMINGSKATKGADVNGIRTMSVTGQAPVVIPGRSGDQFFPYIEGQIAELYNVAEIAEELEEKTQGDPWGELFKSARHKKKFIIDAEKFEFFQVAVCKKYLDLAKNYFDESFLIPAVGRNETINISEFKNTAPQCTQIKVEPMSDDLDSTFGKSLQINQLIQYSSGKLEREDIGLLMRNMPFLNKEQISSSLTINYDRAVNIILELDRGNTPMPNKYDDGPYIIKRLTNRTVLGDYKYLAPQIQQNYELTIKLYEELEAQKAREIQAATADAVPTTGAMIKVAWYVKDPTNPSRSVQATLPASSIEWLVKRLEDQGSAQKEMGRMGSQGATADVAQILNQGSSQQQQSPQMGMQDFLALGDQRVTNGGIQ